MKVSGRAGSRLEPVVITGIGGVFPGAATLDDFWNIIAAGRDVAREVPAGRWMMPADEVVSSSQATPDKVYTSRGCYLEDVQPDTSAWNLPTERIAGMDPLFHVLLQAGHAAWADAKMEGVDRARTGIILGNIALPTTCSSALGAEVLLPVFTSKIPGLSAQEEIPGTDHLNRFVAGLPAGVLAESLGLGGGSVTLDAACASSLYAIKLAVDELQAGRCDAVLAGGVSRPDCLYTQMGFSQLRALSPTGKCSPFDAAGNGLVVGEGAGVLILKRLSDAEAAGDHIYGVIRGAGLSNDIEGNVLAPSSEGQLRAMRAAYDEAGWKPETVDLIECHATGTPVGDAVEFASLCELWGETENDGATCVLGAVKANVGHLLTGAGGAAFIKVLLAMKHRTLPPMANFSRAGSKIPLADSPFRILEQKIEWTEKADRPRRAAVSGFGFGGINAHILVEEYQAHKKAVRKPAARTKPVPASPLAIVGMDACFGPWRDLKSFQHRVLGRGVPAEPSFRPTWYGVDAPQSWRGYFIDHLDIPTDRYRIPPKELEEMLPQQLLALQVAAGALGDAALVDYDRTRAGAFVGIGLDLATTHFHFRWSMETHARNWAKELGLRLNDVEFTAWVKSLREAAGPALNANRTMGALGGIVASRIAREFKFGGACHTVSSEETSGLRALEMAMRALRLGELDVALAGAVDLAGDVRAMAGTASGRGYAGDEKSPPFSIASAGTIPGEGAAMVVLKRLEDAKKDGNRIYAIIRGIGVGSAGNVAGEIPGASGYHTALKRAYSEAETSAGSVSYIETHGSGHPEEDAMEAGAIAGFFGERSAMHPIHLGSAKAEIGHAGAASGMASVVKAALALYQEVLPPLKGGFPLREEFAGGNFHVAAEPAYWLRNREDGPRRAGVSGFSVDGNCVHAVLESCEETQPARTDNERYSPLGGDREKLFLVRGGSGPEISRGLDTLLEKMSEGRSDFAEIAQGWGQKSDSPRSLLCLALVARDKGEFGRIAQSARKLVLEAVTPISDRDRIFYSSKHLAAEGKVAFIYPGSGNHFPGMGRDLALEWPEILRQQDTENEFLASQLVPETFWSGKSRVAMNEDHQALIFGQVALGTMVTDIVRAFGVEPGAVIGYSLGESAGLFSTRAWKDRDEMYRRMRGSTLFTEDMAGPCKTVRKAWKLGRDEKVDWDLGVVDRPAVEVRNAIQKEARVYLLIVNTPGECVIGGDRPAVARVVKHLGCHWFSLQGVTTVHCEVAKPVRKPYRELHLFPTSPPPGVAYYSGAWGKSYPLTRESAADSILAQALDGVDYPAVINAAYADGFRVFIEMGPGGSCSRMISRILEGREFLARPVCVANQSAVGNMLRLIANLAAEGVDVDLSPLYGRDESKPPVTSNRILSVPTGGTGFSVPPPPAHNRGIVRHEILPPRNGHAKEPPLRHVDGKSASRSFVPEDPLVAQLLAAEQARVEAHAAYLEFAGNLHQTMAETLVLQQRLVEALGGSPAALQESPAGFSPASNEVPRKLNRAQCLEYAIGKIGNALGSRYAEIDSFPTRVRLPDEPLMLVDRITDIEGEPCSMTPGRVVTEHDVRPGSWYLDCDRIPTCIAVEAGQADLFLSGFLGIDLETRGLAVYRLLDAVVTFHRGLPGPGEVIRYDIHIDRFMRQGTSWLFRFRFEGTVGGQPLLTMRDGCAGFFTAADLAAGKGIVHTALDRQSCPGKRPTDWREWVPMEKASYDDAQVEALRRGDLAGCFGALFGNLALQTPVKLPSGKMKLVHRVLDIDPTGGRFGLGTIRGEADIHPDDWFITCHFIDDRVMPGTLMYECCLHTLRIFLMRMGWVGETADTVLEPVPGIASQLKCRGQVLESTKQVWYDITIKELGYRPEPYAVVDALMYADGRPIVEITNMSLQMTGLTFQKLEEIWGTGAVVEQKPALYDFDRIFAFATGKPSDAFGEHYKIFDAGRKIARLPGPPYQFLDRVTEVHGEPWKLVAGPTVEAQYNVPVDAWYFAENRQGDMPFAVLLEIALQPCGWLAAYLGSALTSETDLKFRNLGGTATQFLPIFPDAGILATRVKITKVSSSGGMIIQNYEYEVRSSAGLVYRGDTYFGFFSTQALAQQVGIREAKPYQPKTDELARARAMDYPVDRLFPGKMVRMVDRVAAWIPDGGPAGLGFIRGTKRVDPGEWFFQAHFFEDPVCPGSLGLESFLQLLKVVVAERWGWPAGTRIEAVTCGKKHEWVYRGQIVPANSQVTVEAVVTSVNEEKKEVTADGFLAVDGRVIYGMKHFVVRLL